LHNLIYHVQFIYTRVVFGVVAKAFEFYKLLQVYDVSIPAAFGLIKMPVQYSDKKSASVQL